MNGKIVTATSPYTWYFSSAFKSKIDVVGKWNYPTKSPIINMKALERADLVIFTGGEDINPSIYGQENLFSYFNDKRDTIEKIIFRYAMQINKKILGVCRGHQLINALLGGSLVQDIWTQLNEIHNYNHGLYVLEEDAIIPQYFIEVNSMHHQGVREVGNGLVGTTFYNGVFESCESENIITTQFHPEFMDSNKTKPFFNFISSWANLN